MPSWRTLHQHGILLQENLPARPRLKQLAARLAQGLVAPDFAALAELKQQQSQPAAAHHGSSLASLDAGLLDQQIEDHATGCSTSSPGVPASIESLSHLQVC